MQLSTCTSNQGKPPSSDYFETAIANLRSNCAALYGGYYEPASDRDIALANGIADLLKKFNKHPFSDENM